MHPTIEEQFRSDLSSFPFWTISRIRSLSCIRISVVQESWKYRTKLRVDGNDSKIATFKIPPIFHTLTNYEMQHEYKWCCLIMRIMRWITGRKRILSIMLYIYRQAKICRSIAIKVITVDWNFIGVASLMKFFTICKSLDANEYL